MSDLLKMGTELMRQMDTALADYTQYNKEEADADFQLTQAEALAILDETNQGTVVEKQARATDATKTERRALSEARANRQVAQKALDMYSSQLSFIQTAMKQQQIEYNATTSGQMNTDAPF